MMRSLYAGVSGMQNHQTRLDVIGNNVANVNTTAYKSQSVSFSDVMYQTTSYASGANAATGTGGVNAMQIGLEYEPTTVGYGTMKADGSVDKERSVTNHRICALLKYNF